RFFARLDAAKECSIGFVHTPQGLLQTAGVQTDASLFAPLAEVGPLPKSRLSFARRLIAALALSQGSVVHLAALLKQPVQCLTFGPARIQAIFIRLLHCQII